MDHGGGALVRSPGGLEGGDWEAWAGQEHLRNHRRQETIGGDEGFIAGKGAGIQIDREPMARECGESREN